MPSSTVTLTASSASSLPGPASSSSSALHATVAASPALAHLSPADRHKFASYGLGQRRKVDIPIVHHGFERQVRLQPDAIAVEHSLHNHSLTYGQLDRKANRLARRLRHAHDIRPGTRVCVLACRSIYYVLAVLAVLKAGGQYVPIDGVTVTDATLQHILVDSAAELCLVMREYRPRVGDTTPALVIEDAMDEDERVAACADKPEDLSTPDDGCYVIYTSGTTGKPKGVDVRHRGVTNVISGSPGNVGMRPGMRVAQLLNIAFDMGAWECLSALYNGCTLCLRGNTSKEWAALLKTVDVVISTPSILMRHNPADYPTIKHVIVGGEPCPQALADNWARYTTFNNCCGPTEISICNTVQRHTPGYPLSIGTPIPNTNVYILGRDPTDTRAAAVGEVGCMWVGGVGVSRGYLNLPDKTAERWAPDPFLGVEGALMFNTGDLGRWRPDGQLDHHGRADDQVKVKGFRVELDGVSAAMRAHPDVSAAVALLVEDKLWGFVTPANLDLDEVRKATAKLQPYYAVPSEWLALDAFTFTPNGKVDKRALRALAEASRLSAQSGPADPSTPAAAGAARPDGLGLPAPPNHLAVASQPYSQSLPGTPYMPPKKSSLPPSPSESAFGIASPPSSVRGEDDNQLPEAKSLGGNGPRLMLALAVAIGAVLMVSALARVERSKLFGL